MRKEIISLLDNAVGDIPALQLDTQQIVTCRQARKVELVSARKSLHQATRIVEHIDPQQTVGINGEPSVGGVGINLDCLYSRMVLYALMAAVDDGQHQHDDAVAALLGGEDLHVGS